MYVTIRMDCYISLVMSESAVEICNNNGIHSHILFKPTITIHEIHD